MLPAAAGSGGERARLTGHVAALGHHPHQPPGVRFGDRPERSSVATSAAAITRSAACSSVLSDTSSVCHSPESKKNVATRYGGTPVRNRRSSAEKRTASGGSRHAP